MPEPRLHHRYFSHRALPELAYQEKKKFFHSAETQGEVFMYHLWKTLGLDLDPEERIDEAEVLMKIKKHDAIRGIVAILPPAQAVSEAYFCAFTAIEKKGLFGGGSMGQFRYFVLERDEDYRDRVRTKFVEYDAKRNRAELGRGCLPDSDDFWRAVRRYLEFGTLPTESGPLGIK